jgi:photosystem II stability/assembly factor-like uncharacterized protein
MYFRSTFLYICIFLLYSASAPCTDTRETEVSFERMGPFGGDVRSLLIDVHKPSVVYLGTSSGKIFKSLDGGDSWNALFPGIGKNGYVVDTLAQHPNDPDHIYAGAWDLHSEGGGLYESRDGGITWTPIVLPQAYAAVRGLSICKSDPSRMIVGTLEGAYVTSDGGHIWKKVGGGELQKARSVAIDPNDYRFLYVGTWRLAYRSNNFGRTWSRVDKGMPLDSDIFSISISPEDPRVVYSSACSGVYRSTNMAQTWTRLRVLPDRFNIRAHVVAIDPTNDRRIYVGTIEGLFVSDNEGRTWTRLTSKEVIINEIQIDPGNNRHILVGTEYDGVLQSKDGGRTWKESNIGFVHKKISWILPDPVSSGRFIAGLLSGAGGLYLYDDQASKWTLSQIEPGMRILSFLILPRDHGKLAGTTQGVYWEPKGSNRWIKLKGSIGKCTVFSLELDPSNPVIYAGTDQGIYRTSISAMDFRMPPGYRFSPKAWCISAPQTSPGLVYAGTSLGLLRSWDQGTTWNVISAYGLPDRAIIGALAVSPSNKDRLFVGTSAGLFESQNGGIHWKRAGDRRMEGEVSSVVFLDDSGNRILSADKTTGGVFYSKDGGESWDRISSPEHESPIYCIVKDPKQLSRVYIGTQSDGVYRFNLP